MVDYLFIENAALNLNLAEPELNERGALCTAGSQNPPLFVTQIARERISKMIFSAVQLKVRLALTCTPPATDCVS